MRAIQQNRPGSADTLFIGEAEMPQVGPGQLLVRVHAAGVNRADIVQREGRYPPPPGASPLLGLEVAGEVVSVAEEVIGFRPGDAVFGLVAGGGYAEYVLLDAPCAILKPDWLSFEEAATLPEAWMTAWLNLVDLAQLGHGEQALIHAGASGVGAAATQLAGLRGAKAYVTVSSEAKAAFCRQLGAAYAINYRERDFGEAIRELGGVDVVLDCIGGSYLERNIASLKADGRLVVIGLMGGAAASLDMGRLLMKRLTVRGSTLRPQSLATKAKLTAALREVVLPALRSGNARTTLDCVFPWEQTVEAHRYVEASSNAGKVILRVA